MKLTLLLVILNILVFFFSLTNPDYILDNYGFSIQNFLKGNYHTIVTSLFLHASFIHLTGNMIALFFLGWTIEKNVKKWQYLLVYFTSGIIGNLSIFIPFFGYSSETIAIGASAAISGLVGLGTFLCPGKLVLFPAYIPLPFVLAGALYFLATVSNLFSPSTIGYSAHLFGIITGGIFGLIWGKNRLKRIIIFIALLLLILALPTIISYFFKLI